MKVSGSARARSSIRVSLLEGDVEIGENCTIGQNTRIKDSIIGNGTSIQSSVILESKVGNETQCGTVRISETEQ